MSYRAVNCRSSLGVASKDAGKGRCRLTSEQFKTLSIQIGWVVRIRLVLPNRQCGTDILCTSWPDSLNRVVDENVVYVDSSVQFDDGGDLIESDWMECDCKIIATYRSVSCASFRVALSSASIGNVDEGFIGKNIEESKENMLFHAAAFSGLPIAAGVVIRAGGKARPFKAIVSTVNVVGLVGVVHLGSVIFPEKQTYPSSQTCCRTVVDVIGNSAIKRGSGASSSGSGGISCIDSGGNRSNIEVERLGDGLRPVSSSAVVEELRSRVVAPFKNLRSAVLLRGVLLGGPPGVGKTFAVKALKTVCEGECAIVIRELNIPDLLSSQDPIKLLQEVLLQLAVKPSSHPCHTFSPNSTSGSSSASGSGATGGTANSGNSIGISPVTPWKLSNTVSPSPSTLFTSSSPRTPGAPSSTAGAGAVTTPTLTPATATGTSTPHKWNIGLGSSSTKKALSVPHSSSPRASCNAIRGDATGQQASPSLTILVIDEIDALGAPGSHSIVQSTLKQYLCAWFDDDKSSRECCVIATSNRPGDVDPCLRRGGRLEREIDVTGSKLDRYKLLASLLRAQFTGENRQGIKMKGHSVCAEDIHCAADIIADRTGGYVAADITALVAEAMSSAASSSGSPHHNSNDDDNDIDYDDDSVNEITHDEGGSGKQDHSHAHSSESSSCSNQGPLADSNTAAAPSPSLSPSPAVGVLLEVFTEAMNAVPPSCLRGLALQLPDLSYDDVIGYEEVKRSLRRILSFSSSSMKNKVARFGLKSPGGALLYGPPGNSKTRLILAAAAHHGLPVISLSSADIYSPYVGDAEAEIRKAFRVARQASPCVLFLDELDALVTDRAGVSGSGVSVEARVLATLLTEMDGISSGNSDAEESVIVMAATNRVDCIDAALLRKGRFHQTLFVPPPNEDEREGLLQYFGLRCGLSAEDVASIRASAGFNKEGLSGADVENICKERFVSNINTATATG